MVLPLLLGLGLLASGHAFTAKRREAREADEAGRYQGLLGTSPGENMGPPDEAGGMGYGGGSGLLADPTLSPQVRRQLEYAGGIMGLPGQRNQAAGMALLNEALQRQQRQEEAARQASQFAQQFGLQRDQFDYGRGRDAQDFQFRQEGRALDADRFALTFGAGRDDEAARREQWRRSFGLQQRSADRADAEAGAGPALPKLPTGYMYQQTPDGGAIAAPIPGTPDHVKGTAGLSELRRIDGSLGNFLDLMAGKETRTRAGVKIRQGGTGTEVMGDNAQRLSSMRGAIIASVAKMRDMGVLDKNEYERLDEQLPDPTGWTSLGKRSKSAEIAYEKLREELRAKMTAHLEAHPWLVPAIPQGFEPEGKVAPIQPGTKPRRRPAADYTDQAAGGIE